jgi:hypothetical protein
MSDTVVDSSVAGVWVTPKGLDNGARGALRDPGLRYFTPSG